MDWSLIRSCQKIANKTLNISIGGTLLAQASSVHYVGITIDPTLLIFGCSVNIPISL